MSTTIAKQFLLVRQATDDSDQEHRTYTALSKGDVLTAYAMDNGFICFADLLKRNPAAAELISVKEIKKDGHSHLSPDDLFTTWHDHEAPEIHEMSRFDMAARAWHEAWERCTPTPESKNTMRRKIYRAVFSRRRGHVVTDRITNKIMDIIERGHNGKDR